MLVFYKDEEPSIPWEKLGAKKLLSFKDIINGLVPLDSKRGDNTNTMSLKEIYSMRPEYAESNYRKFSGWLSSLQKTISANKKRADEDQEAFDTFVENNPILYYDVKGNIQWQGSELQHLLKEDSIQLGAVVHRYKSKKEFWILQPAYYINFPLKQFRDKTKQEIGTAKICLYTEGERETAYI